jgi:hypothetical protein
MRNVWLFHAKQCHSLPARYLMMALGNLFIECLKEQSSFEFVQQLFMGDITVQSL